MYAKSNASSTATDKDYYSVSEAARLLRVSPATIWRWIEAGKLTAYRVGPKNIRIRKTDLEVVIKPARAKERVVEKEPKGIWARYDPAKVNEMLEKTAGSWADLDTAALVADLYREREEGSRPKTRP